MDVGSYVSLSYDRHNPPVLPHSVRNPNKMTSEYRWRTTAFIPYRSERANANSGLMNQPFVLVKLDECRPAPGETDVMFLHLKKGIKVASF